jgi:hypothetical protein
MCTLAAQNWGAEHCLSKEKTPMFCINDKL